MNKTPVILTAALIFLFSMLFVMENPTITGFSIHSIMMNDWDVNMTYDDRIYNPGDNFTITLSQLGMNWSNYTSANLSMNVSGILNISISTPENRTLSDYNNPTYRDVQWNFTANASGKVNITIKLFNGSGSEFITSFIINVTQSSNEIGPLDISRFNVSVPEIDILNRDNFTINITSSSDWDGISNVTVLFHNTTINNITPSFFDSFPGNLSVNFSTLDNMITEIEVVFYGFDGSNNSIKRNVTIYNASCPQTNFGYWNTNNVKLTNLTGVSNDNLRELIFYYNSSKISNGVDTWYIKLNISSLIASQLDFNHTFKLQTMSYLPTRTISNKEFIKYNISAKITYYDKHVCYHREILDLYDMLKDISLEGIYNGSESCENLIGLKITDTNSSDGNFTGLTNISINLSGGLNSNTELFKIIDNNNNSIIYENITCDVPKNYLVNISFNSNQYNKEKQINLYRPDCDYINLTSYNIVELNFSQTNTYINYSSSPEYWYGFNSHLVKFFKNNISAHNETGEVIGNNENLRIQIESDDFRSFNNLSGIYDYNLSVFFNTDYYNMTCYYLYSQYESADPNITIRLHPGSSRSYEEGKTNNIQIIINNSGNAVVNFSTTIKYNEDPLAESSTNGLILNKSEGPKIINITLPEKNTGSYNLISSSSKYIKDGKTIDIQWDFWVTEELDETITVTPKPSGGSGGSSNFQFFTDTKENYTPTKTDEEEEVNEENTTEPFNEQPAQILDESDKASSSSNYKINELISNGIRRIQTYSYENGKTIISNKLKNGNILPQYDILITIDIPKDIIENTDYIEGNYTIIKYDPIIQFYIDKLDPGEEITLDYNITKEISEHEISRIITTINSSFSKDEIDEFERKTNETSKAIESRTDAKKDSEGNTIITNIINPKKDLEDVKVYLEIPKCLAEHLSELEFENNDFEIIEEDPLIAWEFDEINKPLSLDFKTLKEVDEECWKKIIVLPIADQIKEKLTLQTSWYQKFLPVLIFFIILLLAPFISKHANILKKEEHEGKHIFHKDILKELEFGFEELMLSSIIILNILDFFEILPPDLDFIKKIISWTFLAILLYQVSITEILFGFRKHWEDVLTLIAYFGLMFSDIINAFKVLYIEIIEAGRHAYIKPFLNVLLTYSNELLYIGFYCGLGIILFLSLMNFTKRIEEDSLLGSLKHEGKPRHIYSYLERFFFIILTYIAFFIIFFKFFMEWFAIAVDAVIAVVGIIIYFMTYIKKHHKHYHEEHFVYKIGTIGEHFYEKFTTLFKHKNTIFYALSGMLILHLLVDLSNYIIPYITSLHDSLYFMQLATDEMLQNHTPLIPLLGSILPLENIALSAKIIGIYVLEFIAMITFLVMPAYIWYDKYKQHRIVPHRFINSLIIASATMFAMLPLFRISPITGKSIIGIDLELLNIFDFTNQFDTMLMVVAATFITAYILAFSKKINARLIILPATLSTAYFAYYIYNYLYSWSLFFINAILSFMETNILMAVTFGIFFATIIIFYITGFIAYVYISLHRWAIDKHEVHKEHERKLMGLIDYLEKVKNINYAKESLLRVGWDENLVHEAIVDYHKIDNFMHRIIGSPNDKIHHSKAMVERALLNNGWDAQLVKDIIKKYY